MDITLEEYDYPYSCQINLTSSCNLRCRHCFGDYSNKEQKELSLEEWKKVIDELSEEKVFYLNISGGEPTKSPLFKEFINYLVKKGMYFILTTNGVFSKQTREFILKNKDYIIYLKFSLDGATAKSHGYIRRDSKGNYNPQIFKTTLENIMFFKNKKVPLVITTVVHKENIKEFSKLQKLIKKINPHKWLVSPIIPVGRGEKNKFISEVDSYFNKSFWKEIRSAGKKDNIQVRLVDMPIESSDKNLYAYSCSAALNMCEIHSDGTVSPCTLSRVLIPENKMKFENIKDQKLREIWHGKLFNEFRSYMNKGCEGCKMLSKCNKCVAQSFRYFGNGESPTPFCIREGKNLGLKDYKKYSKIISRIYDNA